MPARQRHSIITPHLSAAFAFYKKNTIRESQSSTDAFKRQFRRGLKKVNVFSPFYVTAPGFANVVMLEA